MKNLKSYIVFLSRNKLYSFVNVFGLSVSMMFVIIISSYLVGEFSTDRFHSKADRIHIFAQNIKDQGVSCGSAYLIGKALQERYPEIEKTCGYMTAGGYDVEIQNRKILSGFRAVDTTFLSMFDYKLLKGNRQTALSNPSSAIISEDYALKAFGAEDPIGQTLTVMDTVHFVVTGVIEDFTNTAMTPIDVIVPFSNMKYFNSSILDGYNNAGSVVTFLQMAKGADLNHKEDDIIEYFKTFYLVYSQAGGSEAQFVPIVDFYFHDTIIGNDLRQGDLTMNIVLVIIVGLIMLFAVFNYINLTVAQTGFRAKEMATRRLYGADYKGIIFKMISESVIMAFVALLIGFLFSLSAAPHASKLIGRDIQLLAHVTPFSVALSLMFVIVIGVFSGLLPAMVIIRFKPIDVVKGSFAFKSKMSYSKIFIVIQSIITIVLIGSSMTIYSQVSHMMKFDYGYNTKGILNITNRALSIEGFKDEVLKLSSVKRVGFSAGTPFRMSNNSTEWISSLDKMVSFQEFMLDSASYKMFDFEVIKENHLDGKDGWYLNEAALREMNMSDTITYYRTGDSYNPIVKVKGVIKDFQIYDMRDSRGNSAMKMRIVDNYHTTNWGKWRVWNILVQVDGDLVQARRDIEKIYTEMTDGSEFTGQYIDDDIEASFATQRRMQNIMVLFTIIAMIISALGLLAMSSYFIQQRAKEVAIRKVFGSTRVEVLRLIIWQYLRLSVIAFFIACPIIWYVMSEWLSGYAYRIDVSVWIIILAGLLNLAIAFATVYWQGNAVANTNPTKSMQR